jgi:catechol 2,3-dioxygenase-like lactoylglutathione lyase family enzyme
MFRDSRAFSGFAVKDLDTAKAFYGTTLGLEIEDHPMGTIGLHLGSGATVMVYPKPDHVPASYTILNFPVTDVEAAVDGLIAAGVRMERYEGFEQDAKGIARDERGPTIAWFTDPSGNILAVLDEAPG